MISALKSTLSRNITNARGWKTDRKIVVIESDDWGSIRMPNSTIYNDLLNRGIRVDLCPYNKYDTLANVQDFEVLFNTLRKHSDFRDNYPIITFNTNVANPDFDKIINENFEKYYYHDFTVTLNEYYPNEDVFSMWKEGISEKLIYPQFHGREHLNSEIWLDLLRKGNSHLLEAFRNRMYGLSFATSNEIRLPFLAALIYNSEDVKAIVEDSILEGTAIFERIFGFNSKSFIAPLYTWSSELESTFSKAGINYIQGSDRHKDYDFAKRKFNRIHNVMGIENKFGQIYLHRNCTFEPTILGRRNNIGNCLKQIENAFFWKKPAVISMHRLNFIGVLNEKNRNENLKELDVLLHKIKKRWGEVEFMHSSTLGDLIKNQKSDDL